jgi:hypothetical protein
MRNDAAFRLATFLITAARDVIDDCLMVEQFGDDFLREVQPRLAEDKYKVMSDRDAFVAALDELAEAFALEAKRRNLEAGT